MKATATTEKPELDRGRRMLRKLLAAKRESVGLTYRKLGAQIGDPGCQQIQSFLARTDRGLPLGLVAKLGIRFFIPIEPLLTTDQRLVVQRLIQHHQLMTKRGAASDERAGRDRGTATGGARRTSARAG